jgi:hypothetical protein
MKSNTAVWLFVAEETEIYSLFSISYSSPLLALSSRGRIIGLAGAELHTEKSLRVVVAAAGGGDPVLVQ